MQPSSCVRARSPPEDPGFSYRATGAAVERKSRNCLLEKPACEDSWLLPLWPTRLADGLGLGSCPTSRWKIRPAARFTVLFGSPVSLSRSTLELGLTCFADLPRHHALAGSNDSEYRPALVAVNRNRTSSTPSCSCRKYCKISGWASPISKPFIAG